MLWMEQARLLLRKARQDLVVDWSPFAVAYWYEDLGTPDPVDRVNAQQLVQAAITWTQGEIGT